MAISSQADSKLCTKCNVLKPLSDFRYRPSQGRHRPRCRDCERVEVKAHNTAYYARNRERVKKASAEYYRNNKEAYRTWQRGYMHDKHREWKRACFAVFGDKCACCGESGFEFLTLDHVNNDGHLHRREVVRNIYEWLVKENFQTDYELQTLCFNCNFAKRYNGGVCPHRGSEGSTTIPQGSRAKRSEAPEPSKEGQDIV